MTESEPTEYGRQIEQYRIGLLTRCLEYQREVVESADKWLLAMSGSAFVFCFASLATGQVTGLAETMLKIAAMLLILSVVGAMMSKGISYLDAIDSIRKLEATKDLADDVKHSELQALDWNPRRKWIIRLNILAFGGFVLAMTCLASAAMVVSSSQPANGDMNDGQQEDSASTHPTSTANQAEDHCDNPGAET